MPAWASFCFFNAWALAKAAFFRFNAWAWAVFSFCFFRALTLAMAAFWFFSASAISRAAFSILRVSADDCAAACFCIASDLSWALSCGGETSGFASVPFDHAAVSAMPPAVSTWAFSSTLSGKSFKGDWTSAGSVSKIVSSETSGFTSAAGSTVVSSTPTGGVSCTRPVCGSATA